MNKITESIKLAAKNEGALSMKEEARLNTLSHCVTMALFRSYDLCRMRRKMDSSGDRSFFRGWSRQCMNKIVDDELFGANVDTLTQIANTQLDIADPIGNPYTKAALGVVARLMTLTVMVPFLNVTDPSRRKAIIKESPRVPLYNGFVRQAVKECTFTAAYVLSSAYVGDYLSTRKCAIRNCWTRCFNRLPQCLDCPQNSKMEKLAIAEGSGSVSSMMNMICNPFSAEKPSDQVEEVKLAKQCAKCHKNCHCASIATDFSINAGKASIAGIVSTLVVAPIEHYGKSKPGMIRATLFKGGRKGMYNGMNSMISKTLQKQAVHRAVARTIGNRYLGGSDGMMMNQRS